MPKYFPHPDRVKLSDQLYGIAMAQAVFGGPRGIWLECVSCPRSHRICGATEEHIDHATDAEVAAVFRHNGWTGQGDSMKRAKCPSCSAVPVAA